VAGYDALFADRADAGRRLAVRLAAMGLEDPIVYALPRGGLAVGAEVARALAAPLEPLIVRKIGAPLQPELAIGAVVDGAPPVVVVNEDVREATGADDAFFERAKAAGVAEIARRRAAWLGDRPLLSPVGHTAIVVDDGLATGASAKAALRALRRQGATRLVLAVPVAPVESLPEMLAEADDVVCLEAAERFYGVGAFYGDFHQLTEAETLALLHDTAK
jgi:putative phosphoribosyl transferase